MCEPATIAATVSVVSTVAQGFQAKQQGEFQEGVSRYNARQLENEAVQTRNIGVEEENRQREQTAQLLSRQRAQIAASGVEIGAGSALQIQEDTQTIGEIDALRIRSNFERQAGSLEEQAELELVQGESAAEAGRSAFTGSLLSVGVGAGASALSGGVASKWFTPSSSASQVATT